MLRCSVYCDSCYCGGDVELNELFREMTVRIFCGGILCAAAMIFVGEGSGKEAVRTCCACIMIAVCIIPLKGKVIVDTDFKAQAVNTEENILKGLKEAGEEEDGAIGRGIAEYAEKRAEEKGCVCRIVVICRDKKPESAQIFAAENDMDTVTEILVSECGLSERDIIRRNNEN